MLKSLGPTFNLSMLGRYIQKLSKKNKVIQYPQLRFQFPNRPTNRFRCGAQPFSLEKIDCNTARKA